MFLKRRKESPVERVVEAFKREATRGQFAWCGQLPAQPARFAEPETPLPRTLRDVLGDLGVGRLYAHQATTVDLVRRGENVVLATPTASGKTLAFNLPVVERLLAEPAARALYVYPTNALVNDQERALRALLAPIEPPVTAAVLTGATDTATRRRYRAAPPRVLLTNPELLHLSLIGHHQGWAALLRGLRFVVLDELHIYRGLFGAHMALVLRRLLRVAALYGARPQIVACSATIGNPGELAERLTGLPFSVVEATGAARGQRTLVVWRPPLIPGSSPPEHDDPQTEAVRLFCHTVAEGLGTLLFAPTRRGAETMLIQARERLGPALAARVAPYRNGYTPEERRRVEEGLKSGRLLGAVSTNALEVGVDIGGLDVVVIAGFPGSRTSFWQQAGRAGRGTRGSLVVYMPYDRVVDGYYATHPEELLAGRFEDAAVDLANPRVVAAHLACAALERGLRAAEPPRLSPAAEAAVGLAEGDGRLVQLRDGSGWAAGDAANHGAVSLRGSGMDGYRIVGPRGELGSIDAFRLHREAYPGAIYLHEGERYRVVGHEEPVRIVRVAHEPGLLITEPVLQTVVRVEREERGATLRAGRHELHAGFGGVALEETTTGYRELHLRGRRHERTIVLPSPLTHWLRTAGCWLVFPAALRRRLEAVDGRAFAAGLHALEHVLPSALALRLLCDPRDVAAIYELAHAGMGGPTLFLVDAREDGSGIAERAAGNLDELLQLCAEIVRGCHCPDGCPACILSSSCWRRFDPVEKPAALALLAELT